MRVMISPSFPKPDAGDGGIRRLVEAELKYLPAYDVEVTEDAGSADVVQIHATALVETGAPIVASTHGLYWTAEQDWPLWAWHANLQVTEVVRRAKLVTAPSEWVAGSLRRGMLVNPTVIGHGVDLDDWPQSENGGYVLWNKARVDVVCDPADMNRLAAVAPDVKFLSTFGGKTANVEIIGRLGFEAMKPIIQRAGVYLSTARETFGIGTLEALACGVPVLGWAHGGNVDIVKHLETGYLAKLGDMNDLLEGLRYCIDNRTQLGMNARADIAERFQWLGIVGKYADVFRQAADHEGPKVSVIVTCYKLAEYLEDCVNSVKAQTMKDWELIIIDDASPDDTPAIAKRLKKGDKRIVYHRNERNLYLSEARNVGLRMAKGKYILPLDADDMIAPLTLEILSGALDKNKGLHIAYGGFELVEPDGKHWQSGWPQQFDYGALMGARKNQNPYCSLMRREVLEHTGGYRRRLKTMEDQDLWVRAASYGFRSAKATDAVTLIYANRPESMSHTIPQHDACAWSPWADRRELTPYGSVGQPTQGKRSWPVASFDKPTVSIVIPVGKGHGRFLQDALDSVLSQTYQRWEAIVVNDSGEDLSQHLQGFPFVRQFSTAKVASGPGAARNVGVRAAKGQYIVCLDADDILLPLFLERVLGMGPGEHDYVYCNHLSARAGQDLTIGEFKEFDCQRLLGEALHSVTTLVPRQALLDEPFDEVMTGWEDWEIFIRLASKGYCGIGIEDPLMVYRLESGGRRETSLADKDRLLSQIEARYNEYIHGGKEMACGGCSKKPAVRAAVAAPVSPGGGGTGDLVKVLYMNLNIAQNTYIGRSTRKNYGRRGGGQEFYVFEADATADPLLRMI